MSTNTQIGKYNYCRITRTIDGKKKQFYGTSKRDCERKYKEFLIQKEQDQHSSSIMSFGNLMKKYNETVLLVNSKYSPGTRKLYYNSYKTHIEGTPITKKVFKDLTTEEIQNFYNNLDITSSALQTLHKYLLGFFKWMKSENIIRYVVMPSKQTIKHQDGIIIWTDDEIENIMSHDDYYLHDLLVFALYTGMRISELLGLKWEDIYDDSIHIKRQYYRGTFIPPKNRKERIIPMHAKIREVVNSAKSKKGLIFTTSQGAPLDYHNVNTSLHRFYRRINVDQKKFHAYRATFITNLCRNGVPIQTVRKLAGHSNINVTAKYYAAISIDELTTAINKI